MNISTKARHPRLRILGSVLALAAIAVAMTGNVVKVQGGSGSDAYRIEEDWELVVSDADPVLNAPQVTCTISPADMGTAYCAFDLNYHTQPDYVAGGLQVHTWDPTDPIEYSDSTHTQVMSSASETVTWTQTMTLDPNSSTITFQVINGQSQSWGSFGGNKAGNHGHLILTMNTNLPNLNAYDCNVSLDNSGVSFASNLVVSQTLVAVRYYDVNGNLIKQITTPQIVHPQQ